MTLPAPDTTASMAAVDAHTDDPYEQKLRGRVLNALRPATRRTKVSLDLLCRYMEARGTDAAFARTHQDTRPVYHHALNVALFKNSDPPRLKALLKPVLR